MKKLLVSLWLCLLLVSCGGTGGETETTTAPTGGVGAATQLEQDLLGLSR